MQHVTDMSTTAALAAFSEALAEFGLRSNRQDAQEH